MTSARWEYASVNRVSERRLITKADAEYRELSDKIRAEWDLKEWPSYWWNEQTVWTSLPDAEPVKQVTWTTGAGEVSTTLAVLNELGQQGWELVSSGVAASAMIGNQGWEPAGYPIHWSFVLKRPAN